ncbi:hypothetical protein PRZ48_002728 [Zasmidium cellare]|uniref:glucan endo-1,3-beta-D-glucosidase n=1 Tax=Zasmidium cellare TaxID=395010 RepID=A0ABR0ET15_ZASCE|nr:hypothetical protein PRZ48_002728 [Zasmidium cellare]
MHILPLALLGTATAQAIRGFNSGGIGPKGPKSQQDFEAEFNKIKNLPGTAPFTSIRLFTMIQHDTASDPTVAIPAAISTNTHLLLGLWASAGQDAFNNELDALKKAITQYGEKFTSLIDAISCGSEDLYRITPTGIANKAGIGASPDTLVQYIQQLRDAIKDTPASGAKITHVDTWTAWVNESNFAVTKAVDWLGMDAYPYYEQEHENTIENAGRLFFEAYNKTVAVSQGKAVKVTETGWPVAGPQFGQAVASVENAKRYWDAVACPLLGDIDTWWFTLDDAKGDPNEISFSTIKSDLGDPLFDLGCPGK